MCSTDYRCLSYVGAGGGNAKNRIYRWELSGEANKSTQSRDYVAIIPVIIIVILSPAHTSATSSPSCTHTTATLWLHSFHRITGTIPFPNCLWHMWDSWRCAVQLQGGCQTTIIIGSSKTLLHLVKLFTKGSSVLLHCASLHPWACKSSYCRACAQE